MNASYTQPSAWLSTLPPHWRLLRLKYLSSCNDEVLREDTPGAQEIEYIDIGSVSNVGEIISTEAMAFAKAPSRARRVVRQGDVLISTVRTYLKAIAPVTKAPENLIASTGFAVIRCGSYAISSYMAYALRTDGFVGEVISRSVGISYPAINSTDLVNITIPAPPLAEQTQIAKFLDYEAAKIDALIEKQQQLIALLKEKRQAVISHAVTKGLNPDVPMRDSGVEWLGSVPAHWRVIALKHLTETPIIDGPHETPNKCDEGIPFISAESISKGFIDFNKIWGYISQEAHTRYSKRYKPHTGDILMVKLGATTGTVAIVETKSDFNVWVPLATIRLKKNIDPRYIFHLLRSDNLKNAYQINWTYGTQQTLGLRTISNLRLPIPPKQERSKIAKHLDSLLPLFESLSAKADQGIAFLQERRTALISAAVTGKIDVRSWKPPKSKTKPDNA